MRGAPWRPGRNRVRPRLRNGSCDRAGEIAIVELHDARTAAPVTGTAAALLEKADDACEKDCGSAPVDLVDDAL